MLKISIAEKSNECRLVLKGEMLGSGLAELTAICMRLKVGLRGRVMVIDIKDVMRISQEGENSLLELINNGAKLRPEGVLANSVLQQLAYRSKKQVNDLIGMSADLP